MSAVVLQGLLDYLKSTLSMDSRQWLAAHLVEPSAEAIPYTKEELIAETEDPILELLYKITKTKLSEIIVE